MKLQTTLLSSLALTLLPNLAGAQQWLRTDDEQVYNTRLLARPDGTLVDLRVQVHGDYPEIRVHDHEGAPVSMVRLDPLSGGTARARDMALVGASDVIVAGTYFSEDEATRNPFVGRFDPETGAAVWLRRVPWLGYTYDRVIVGDDDLYLLGAEGSSTLTVTKYDHDGDFQWCRSWAVATNFDWLADACLAPDGGILFLAEDDLEGTHVVSVDGAGDFRWHRYYDSFLGEAVCVNAAGEIVVGGRVDYRLHLLQLSATGTEIERTEYVGHDATVQHLVTKPGGGLLVTARRRIESNTWRPSLMSLDADGVVEWSRMYDFENGYQYQSGQEAIAVGERGWILHGSVERYARVLGLAPDGTTDAPCVVVTDLASLVQPGLFGPDKPPTVTSYVYNQVPEAWILQPTPGSDGMQLDCGDPCSVGTSSFGSGVPGTALITPELAGVSGACVGAPHPRIELTKGLGGSFGIFAYARDTTAIPLLGGTLYLDPQTLVLELIALDGPPGVPGQGSWSLEIQIDLTSFVGVPLTAQVAVADPAAPEGWSFSPGLNVVVQ